jgi:uncharacterized protein YbjT (DUF2867 family)
MSDLHVVTGAFGFSGKYIADRLLKAGYQVRTLTNSPERANLFGGRVEAHPFNFNKPELLARSLEGASVLYNTYWVRFNDRDFKQADAVENTLTLFKAARLAGVRRVVHVSITNPSENSPFEYFRDKAILERALAESGLSCAILRPAVLFGKEDILINNIAWMLRRFPVFGVFGNGQYRIQPIYVDDLSALAVEQGLKTDQQIINAIGPETFSYRNLIATIGDIIGKHRPIISITPEQGQQVGSMVGKMLQDVTITREEIEGLMAGLLYTDSPPTGTTKFTDWARLHAGELGKHYASELARRRNRKLAYQDLCS